MWTVHLNLKPSRDEKQETNTLLWTAILTLAFISNNPTPSSETDFAQEDAQKE